MPSSLLPGKRTRRDSVHELSPHNFGSQTGVEPSMSAVGRRSRDVLLIEPPSADRERHAKTLSRHGYKVFPAGTIEEGRKKWSPDHYGLVILSLDGFAEQAGDFCDRVKESDAQQLIALIFHPDQQLPATDCPTLIFTTEPDEYFLARVETLTAAAQAA